MLPPSIRPMGEKHVRISAINPYLAACLFELPETLQQRENISAHDRLFPLPTMDTRINAEWRELVEPELHHLFQSHGETVTRDLTRMTEDGLHTNHLEVIVPIEHLPAWLSAVNEARLIMASIHGITEGDLNTTDFEPQNPKSVVVIKIGLLGELLAYLVDYISGNAPPAQGMRRRKKKSDGSTP